MNWLLCISGWILGMFFLNEIIEVKDYPSDDKFYILALSWLAVWIWVCWKFIV